MFQTTNQGFSHEKNLKTFGKFGLRCLKLDQLWIVRHVLKSKCVFLISTLVDQENYLWTLIFICFTNHVHVLFSKFQTRVKYKKLNENTYENDKMKNIAIVLHHQNLT